MKKALLNIDYTYDFVAPEGKLTCGEPGQKLLPYICNVTKTFIEHKDLVVFSIDLHKKDDPYHPESKQFPPHNIE
ncbi:MAG: isochorismatase, partial [Sporosarcina sp.]